MKVIIIISQAFDGVITTIGIRRHLLLELNPVLRQVVQNYWFDVVKLCVGIVLALVISSWPKKYQRSVVIVSCIPVGITICSLLLALRGH